MIIFTVKNIHCFEWEELSIDEDTSSCTKTLANNEKARIMVENSPMFEWSPGMPTLDESLPQIEQNETKKIMIITTTNLLKTTLLAQIEMSMKLITIMRSMPMSSSKMMNLKKMTLTA